MDNVFLGALLGIFAFAGAIIGFNFAVENVESNELQGYHCTEITKHTGIESAKAQVSAYHAMARGYHGRI